MLLVILIVENVYSVINKVENKTRELVIWKVRMSRPLLRKCRGHMQFLKARNARMLEEGCMKVREVSYPTCHKERFMSLFRFKESWMNTPTREAMDFRF